ncbi:hypothetical protein CBR_g5708 [Chara braunii]|uniref:Reverse transcriptase/retrotransposon-derived protein RNase H-like domain-containing protein n=1 Tax=Chara braunii TaxID=69332 RepID=A0A388KJ35_CHABU|nr:hypothetical protein CBR_g5708 [Chara braunii]|eukprot:GBG70075.1 hypothetical protein CBR_g5708 [Chara braunii]
MARDCPQRQVWIGAAPAAAAPLANGPGRVGTMVEETDGLVSAAVVAEEAAKLIPLDQFISLGYPGLGMIGAIQPADEDREVSEWRPSPSEMESGPSFITGEIDVLDIVRALDHRIPLPIRHLLSISGQANYRMLQHCKANRKRFALAKLTTIALEKSEFFLPEISFLGYVVTRGSLRPDSRKVEAVWEAPMPKSLTQVRAFLGLASYYRQFIKGFAPIARPLTSLLRKDQPLNWEAECERAFSTLKEALASAPISIRPDPERQFLLITDWQPGAISAILAQKGKDEREHVVEYASRTIPDERKNDSAPQGECYAVVWGIQHFHPYLYGQKFLLVTDHEPLLALEKLTNYTDMIGRWAVRLHEYEFDIVHRKTERHGNADGLIHLHRPGKVPRCEEITPWKEPELPKGPGYGQVKIELKWTQDNKHNVVSEDVELLIIQAWRTEVEGDLLGFVFGTVEAGHRQPIVGEFLILLTQLLDDLPIDIISHCDESPAPHILSRSLMSYLQWSACLEGHWDNRNYLSHDNYLNPVEIINILFFDWGKPTSEGEEEEDKEEEDESEETPEEDKYYSKHKEHELGAISGEEEAEGASEEEEVGQAETQREDPAVA